MVKAEAPMLRGIYEFELTMSNRCILAWGLTLANKMWLHAWAAKEHKMSSKGDRVKGYESSDLAFTDERGTSLQI
jgi:hypothetical protein